MKTKMIFWSGLHTIGGNIIEIRYGNDRVIFDFGLHYNPADVLLDNAKGRHQSRVADMLRLNMIPKIEGIYDKKDLDQANLTLQDASEAQVNTAVFVSHLHLDHMGAIDALSSKVPLYFSEESKLLYEQLVQVGERPFKPITEIKTFAYEHPVSVGAIQVTGYQIDHDVYGSSALLIETPDQKICYSGDLRMHGQHPERNKDWIEKMKAKNVDYLLIEGTAFKANSGSENEEEPKRQIYEQEVPVILTEKLTQAKGVAFFNFYHRNLDRLKHLIKASSNGARKIVFERETAHLVSIFAPNDNFLILAPESKETPLALWEENLYQKYESITIAQINQKPDAYFVQNSFENIFSLMDYNLENSLYLHSNGMPLGAYDPAYSSMLSFLTTLGIAYEPVHTSGHASKKAILAIIDEIKPKTLVPWHSLAPDQVVPIDPQQNVLRPTLGIWY